MQTLPLLMRLADPRIRDVREELAKYGDDPVTKYNEEIDAQIRAKEARLGKRQSRGRSILGPMGVSR